MAKGDFLRELVPVTPFRDGGEYRDDAVVIVNGKTWIIRRGSNLLSHSYPRTAEPPIHCP